MKAEFGGESDIATRLARRRYDALFRISEKMGIAPPLYRDILSIVRGVADGNDNCYYCGRKMRVGGGPPTRNIVSIDHKEPLARGGTNEVENLVACCHSCNIFKRTMSVETFQRLMKLILLNDAALLDKIYDEVYRGRPPNKKNLDYFSRPYI